MKTLDGARIGVAAQAVGISRRALDESIKYYKNRSASSRVLKKSFITLEMGWIRHARENGHPVTT